MLFCVLGSSFFLPSSKFSVMLEGGGKTTYPGHDLKRSRGIPPPSGIQGKSFPILPQLLCNRDQSFLTISGNSSPIRHSGQKFPNAATSLDFQGDGFPCQGLHEDLHSTAKTQDQVESRLLLDVVVAESAAVLQLLSSEDHSLLMSTGDLIWTFLHLILFMEETSDYIKSVGLEQGIAVDFLSISAVPSFRPILLDIRPYLSRATSQHQVNSGEPVPVTAGPSSSIAQQLIWYRSILVDKQAENFQ